MCMSDSIGGNPMGGPINLLISHLYAKMIIFSPRKSSRSDRLNNSCCIYNIII